MKPKQNKIIKKKWLTVQKLHSKEVQEPDTNLHCRYTTYCLLEGLSGLDQLLLLKNLPPSDSSNFSPHSCISQLVTFTWHPLCSEGQIQELKQRPTITLTGAQDAKSTFHLYPLAFSAGAHLAF